MGELLNYGCTFDGFTTNVTEEEQQQEEDKHGFKLEAAGTWIVVFIRKEKIKLNSPNPKKNKN